MARERVSGWGFSGVKKGGGSGAKTTGGKLCVAREKGELVHFTCPQKPPGEKKRCLRPGGGEKRSTGTDLRLRGG